MILIHSAKELSYVSISLGLRHIFHTGCQHKVCVQWQDHENCVPDQKLVFWCIEINIVMYVLFLAVWQLKKTVDITHWKFQEIIFVATLNPFAKEILTFLPDYFTTHVWWSTVRLNLHFHISNPWFLWKKSLPKWCPKLGSEQNNDGILVNNSRTPSLSQQYWYSHEWTFSLPNAGRHWSDCRIFM